jgi:hypothetical protein
MEVTSVMFRDGASAALASAAQLKYREGVLRERADGLGENFIGQGWDAIPQDIRYALTRLAFHAGTNRALRELNGYLLDGTNPLAPEPGPAGPEYPKRQATIDAVRSQYYNEVHFGTAGPSNQCRWPEP